MDSNREVIRKLKQEWKEYMKSNPNLKRTINHHHYFRSRYTSKFWLKKVRELLTTN